MKTDKEVEKVIRGGETKLNVKTELDAVREILSRVSETAAQVKNPQGIALAYGTLLDWEEKAPLDIAKKIGEVAKKLLIEIVRASKESKSPAQIALASAILLTKWEKSRRGGRRNKTVRKLKTDTSRLAAYAQLREQREAKKAAGIGAGIETKGAEEDFEAQ